MRRYILTGAPGSGKTSILRILAARGYPVIAEAATDVISAEQAAGVAEPWQDPLFVDKIIDLQRSRQQRSKQLNQPGNDAGLVEFYDRSPVCTLALARYSGFEPSAALSAELARIAEQSVYQREVFFVRPLGFIERSQFLRCHVVCAAASALDLLHGVDYSRFAVPRCG